jgi:glycosyltransferase involved in cell wall biosynthesis
MLFDPAPFEQGPASRLSPPDEYAVVYAGSISRTEGVPALIQAFAALAPELRERARLWIIGNTAHGETLDEYRRQASEAGIESRASFLPPLDRQSYAAHLRGADLLVIPRTTGFASQAGFPYKLGEYLASGTPVLVTRFGDVEEYFVSRRDCLMCAPDSAAALSAALEDALRDLEGARAIGAAGQRRARELFSFEQTGGRLDALLSQIA